MPDQTVPLWVTIVSSLSVGSFVGGLVTQLFSSRQQRQEWLKDNKKQEWRELISTLSQSFHYLKNNTGPGVVMSGEQQRGALEADAEARRAIESRIFVVHQIQRENVRERWNSIAAERDWSKRVQESRYMARLSRPHTKTLALASLSGKDGSEGIKRRKGVSCPTN